MNRILILVLLLLSVRAFACDCESTGVIEKYLESDFVATVKITKVYDNEGDQWFYKSDIQIDEWFKGEFIDSLYVYGNNGGNIVTSCDIFIPQNTELIVYVDKNADGLPSIGMCSGLVYLSKDGDSINLAYQKRELQILRTLKASNLANSVDISFWDRDLMNEELLDSLEKFKGIKSDKKFGIYAMNFRNDLTLDAVDVLSGFNEDLDRQLIAVLKNSHWSRQPNNTQDIHPEKKKQLIGIYFYEAEKGYPTFLSIFYL